MTREAEELIRKMKALSKVPWIIQAATVKEVAEDKLSCVVELLVDETEIPNVRLKAGIDGVSDGLVQVPEVASVVLIGMINNDLNSCFICAYSKVAETLIDGGENGGLIKIEDLVEKLNNLEGKVNDLITELQAVVIPLAPSGTYPFAPLFADILPLQETIKEDLENEKVKH